MEITHKITGWSIMPAKEVPPAVETVATLAPLKLLQPRPKELPGITYKITPTDQASLYITINDHVIDGIRKPFEIFINSKNIENYAWVVALTRVVSAIFRQGIDLTFLVEELSSVFDPRGGYWLPGGKYHASLVSEIGSCIEHHLIAIGLIKVDTTAVLKNKLIDKVAIICRKCQQKAMVVSGGCETCTACGYSKCE